MDRQGLELLTGDNLSIDIRNRARSSYQDYLCLVVNFLALGRCRSCSNILSRCSLSAVSIGYKYAVTRSSQIQSGIIAVPVSGGVQRLEAVLALNNFVFVSNAGLQVRRLNVAIVGVIIGIVSNDGFLAIEVNDLNLVAFDVGADCFDYANVANIAGLASGALSVCNNAVVNPSVNLVANLNRVHGSVCILVVPGAVDAVLVNTVRYLSTVDGAGDLGSLNNVLAILEGVCVNSYVVVLNNAVSDLLVLELVALAASMISLVET